MNQAPFDPLRETRILGEIQAEGLRAAAALVDRLVHLVDGPAADTGTREPAAPDASPAGESVQPWIDLWRDLVERTSETVQRLQGAGIGPTGDGVRVGVDGRLTPVEPLVVEVGADAAGGGELWLHNGTATDTGAIVPRCGPLVDAAGTTLACTVTIDPPRVEGLPARSSRGFAITVVLEGPAGPGTYRGLVQAAGADAVWLPLEVVVP